MNRALITKLFLAFVILTFCGISYVSHRYYQWWNQPFSNFPEEFRYKVESGSSLSRVALDLASENILHHPKVFVLIAKMQGDVKIHTGEYFIDADDSPKTLLGKLNRGEIITYQVTLIEGWTFKEALSRLHSQERIVKTLISEEAIIEFFTSLEIESGYNQDQSLTIYQKLEGWFFPDTYQYSAGSKDADILKQAYDRMRDILATEWESRDYSLPYKNAYEALTMASIVEKETGASSERQQIAGVFVRRLQKKMRLQTDPTVIYGLGDSYQGNIRRRHLSQATPYNTYVISGLPPSPIASPGQGAIHAALHPDDGNTLYFVAKGDGSHYFSATLEEHNRAVQRYQVKNRASNYQSAPTIDSIADPGSSADE